jgi:hypothetical protein
MPDDLQDKIERMMGRPPAQQAADDFDPQWLLGPRFRTPGMKAPKSDDWDIPAADGSASDTQNSWKGCGAQRQGDWNQ